MARFLAGKGGLSIRDWRIFHRACLSFLQLRGNCWSNTPLKTCRHCFESMENGSHVTNYCKMGLQQYTQRHNSILDHFVSLPLGAGLSVTVDKILPDSPLRLDISKCLNGQTILDVTSPYHTPSSLEEAHERKTEKYQKFGLISP